MANDSVANECLMAVLLGAVSQKGCVAICRATNPFGVGARPVTRGNRVIEAQDVGNFLARRAVLRSLSSPADPKCGRRTCFGDVLRRFRRVFPKPSSSLGHRCSQRWIILFPHPMPRTLTHSEGSGSRQSDSHLTDARGATDVGRTRAEL